MPKSTKNTLEKTVDRIDRDVSALKKNVSLLQKDVTVLKKDVSEIKTGQKEIKKAVNQNAKDHQEFVEFVQENVAMKSDLEKFATKDDLKKFATKEDLKQYATKEEMNAGFARVMDILEEILANQKVCVADRQRLDARLDRLERKQGITA